MNPKAFSFRHEGPGRLAVDFKSVTQSSGERARVFFGKPFQKVWAARAIGTLREQDYRPTIVTSLSGHIQGFMRLNQVDVPGEAAATGDYHVAFRGDFERVTA